MIFRIMKLARDCQPVFFIEPLGFRVHIACRGKVCYAEELAEALEPVAQYFEASFMV